MHVRIATWDDDPPAGGQGVVIKNLRNQLMARGIQVSTTSGRGSDSMRYPKLSGHGPLDMSIALNLSWRRLLEGAPDLVHVSGGPGGLQFLRRLSVPVVYTANHTFRQSHRWYKPQRAYGLVEALGYRRADQIIAISSSTADSVVEMGVPASRLHVITPGIDVDAMAAPPGTTRVPGRLAFLGRLKSEKGPLDAIEAMKIAIDKRADASGVVIGAGPLEAEVRRECAATDGRISYLGALGDDKVLAELWQAEVLLVPSQFEGLGLVALEAMAAGVAVVGYDVVGLHDTIGSLGSLVREGDIAGLASACLELLDDAGKRVALTEAATAAVRAERSWPACAEAVEAVYRLALGS